MPWFDVRDSNHRLICRYDPHYRCVEVKDGPQVVQVSLDRIDQMWREQQELEAKLTASNATSSRV